MLNEAETRAELIDPALKQSGWETSGDVCVRREFKIKQNLKRETTLSADYVLVYKNVKLAIVEAKKSSKSYNDGVVQAKLYAELLNVRFTYATNGKKIYQIDMENATECEVSHYPTPEELWNMTYSKTNSVWNLLSSIPENADDGKYLRYYQENAVNAVIKAISNDKKRILLTLATGTGKTRISVQIVWKLIKARWNLTKIGSRLPRILFLADRNILADQAFNAFSCFDQSSLYRINPKNIKKDGKLPTSQNIFFTIFQTFMSGETPNFGQYDKDFFDFIIIDECHRGGANDESNWREILNYFSGAVQLGLTATPKRKDNTDTYKYFGEPVFVYSLKNGINDGYLTPFRVRNIKTNFGTYKYDVSDCIEGDLDIKKTYSEPDFNVKIELKEREEVRAKAFLKEINPMDKTLVFCATQRHAGLIRDIINQNKPSTIKDVNYCARVTAEDGELGEEFLRKFQDTEKLSPVILTTSQKLSTGVDAIQIKNIVLLRPVKSIIEFKQIIGRGTRLCDNKEYFTVFDFVGASEHFKDPEWDGPVNYTGKIKSKVLPTGTKHDTKEPTVITLGSDRSVEITDKNTTFYDLETGKQLSAQSFIEKLTGDLPNFFKSEDELRQIWSDPITRKTLLTKFEQNGYTLEVFDKIKDLLKANDSDIFDVLTYIAYNKPKLTRQERADCCKIVVFDNFESRKHAFINFVLEQYVQNGIKELSDDRLAKLINLKYGTPTNAANEIGDTYSIRQTFLKLQEFLYRKAC